MFQTSPVWCREELVLRRSDVIAVGFNGKGYFKSNNKMMRPKPYYNTVLSFKTLDEDALLFLAVNDVKVRGRCVFSALLLTSMKVTLKLLPWLFFRATKDYIQSYFTWYSLITLPPSSSSVVKKITSFSPLSFHPQNQYFSIALEGGHVVFTVQFDSQTRLVMKSSRRHNNRDMIQIQAIVQNRAKSEWEL